MRSERHLVDYLESFGSAQGMADKTGLPLDMCQRDWDETVAKLEAVRAGTYGQLMDKIEAEETRRLQGIVNSATRNGGEIF